MLGKLTCRSMAALVATCIVAAPAQAQTLQVWGVDGGGQVSDAPDGNFRFVTSGATQVIALRSDGSPVIWGGVGDPLGLPPAPPEIAADRFRGGDMGRENAILIRNDGTLVAWTAGHVLSRDLPEGRFAKVATANVHAVGLTEDGSLRAWGIDNPFAPPAPSPGLLNAPAGKFAAVAARTRYTVAVRRDGTIFGWGAAPASLFAGWTPTGTGQFHRPGETFTAVAAGNQHAIALRPDGSIAAWGVASGNNLVAPSHVRFRALAAGFGFSVGLTADGVLWGWGTPAPQPPPLPHDQFTFDTQPGWARYGDTDYFYVPGARYRSVAAGAFQIIAITAGLGDERSQWP